MDDEFDSGVPEDDHDIAIVACPQCAHPNLEFRAHCRRCGGSLRRSANLIPGADFVDWSPTDGRFPARYDKHPRQAIVVLMLLALLGVGAFMRPALAPVALVVGVAGFLGWLIYTMLSSRRFDDVADANDPDAPCRECPECGGEILEIDDICPVCGAVVGEVSSERTD